jgi:hypothetical protein
VINRLVFALSLLILFVTCGTLTSHAQPDSGPASGTGEPDAELPSAPSPAAQTLPGASTSDYEGKQTRRILGIIPNFRSVSVDEKLPPLSSREKLKLTVEDSFDYSSFIYVGLLASVAQMEGSYPEFHSGSAAFARYYWHNFADTLNGNLMTEYLLPSATRQDPRYYTLGRGGLFRRTGYSITRLLVTRNDHGGPVPNVSEIVGNGAAAGISGLYYPAQERTWTKTGQRWVTQVGLDGFSNLVKEFWPDLNSRIFHNKY